MNKIMLILAVLVFLLGWFSNEALSYVSFNGDEIPYFSTDGERDSPGDRVREDQIYVFKGYILINIGDAFMASYADTNSMDPLIDEGSNGLEIKPEKPEDIKIGDIITYRASWTNGLVAHRVVKTGYDENGFYFITRGDNNPNNDPGKVRFEQIEYVLIGIIY